MFFLGPYISNMCDIWFSIMQAHLFVANNNFYDEESDHSNKAVRKTPEIESGHKVSEEVK